MDNEKQPLGLILYPIWLMNALDERMNDINDAIRRYNEVGKPIPNDWHNEYYVLIQQYKDAQEMPLNIDWRIEKEF